MKQGTGTSMGTGTGMGTHTHTSTHTGTGTGTGTGGGIVGQVKSMIPGTTVRVAMLSPDVVIVRVALHAAACGCMCHARHAHSLVHS